MSREYTEAYIWQGQKLIQTRYIDQKYRAVNCRMYAYLPDSHVPVAMYDQQLGLHHIDTDHAGTPKALYSHETGEEVWSTDHETYGKTRDTKTTLTHPVTGLPFDPGLRQQGQYEDVETGLYQNCYRFYDPDVGRYISQDPHAIYHPTGRGGRDIWGGGKAGREGKLNPDGTPKNPIENVPTNAEDC